MITNPYEVKQFPPETDRVRVGRGFADNEDSYHDAWEIANRLADAGLVAVADCVEVNDPLNLHHRLFSDPAKMQLGDLRYGVDYRVFKGGWPTDERSVPVTPNALTRVADQWTSLNTRLRDLLGLADVDYTGDSYIRAIQKLVDTREAVMTRNADLTTERNDLEAKLDRADADLTRLFQSFTTGTNVEFLTLRADVTLPAHQAKLDADTAEKIAEGWRIDCRTVNTVRDGDGNYVTHHEFVKLVRNVAAPAAPVQPAAKAEAEQTVEQTTSESVAVGEFQRIIIASTPVTAVPMNRLDMFPGKSVEEAITELLTEELT